MPRTCASSPSTRQGLRSSPEEQPFFHTFSQGNYYAQYQAAIGGNAGVARHYASACDVLRFWLLYREGGLYMDVDDYLLAPGEPRTLNGKPGESIALCGVAGHRRKPAARAANGQ